LVVYVRVKLIFSRGNYDTHSNKCESDVLEQILITKTNACVHSVIGVPHPPLGGASINEYECVQNEISHDTIHYTVFAAVQHPYFLTP